jgi:hypothetical protein
MFMKNKPLIGANLECLRNERRKPLDARSEFAGIGTFSELQFIVEAALRRLVAR